MGGLDQEVQAGIVLGYLGVLEIVATRIVDVAVSGIIADGVAVLHVVERIHVRHLDVVPIRQIIDVDAGLVVSGGRSGDALVLTNVVHHLIVVVIANTVAVLVSHGLAVTRELYVELIHVGKACGGVGHILLGIRLEATRDPLVPARDHENEGLICGDILIDQIAGGTELGGEA